MKLFPLLLLACAAGCDEPQSAAQQLPPAATVSITNTRGADLATRFNPPPGYQRIALGASSFGYFLRHAALRPHGSAVHYFDGRLKANPGIYCAVIALDVGDKDLQQCADAVMRLRAEYLFATNRPDSICFTLSNGFKADFRHWSSGYRPAIAGRNFSWVKAAAPNADHTSLRAYLDFVYTYAGTLSLAKMLRPVALKDMQPGDVLIVGGAPGHAVTVMDMAVNAEGKKVFLLSQSYMPAQEIQILDNPNKEQISPWYELPDEAGAIHTPQWDFTTGQLKRFP